MEEYKQFRMLPTMFQNQGKIVNEKIILNKRG